jgi:hypothetical protein
MAETLTKGKPQNVTLRFDARELPPPGTYEGWLLVTADNAEPLSRKVALEVSRPSQSIRHRLSLAAEQDKKIILGGVRWCPFDFLLWCSGPGNVYWQEYKLRLWEKDYLQDVSYALVPSELANDDTGQAGLLKADPPTGTIGDEPAAVTLGVDAVHQPGSYKGTLTILAPDGRYSDTINVVVQLRDSLWWPFLVIVAGALAIGWLLRVGVRSTNESIPYHRILIELAWQRLRDIPECAADTPNDKCRKVERELQAAEAALALQHAAAAAERIKAASQILDELEPSKPPAPISPAEEAPADAEEAHPRIEHSGQPYGAPNRPTFFTTEGTITFRIANAAGDSYRWQIRRTRRFQYDETVAEGEGAAIDFKITAGPSEDYVRRRIFRVEARNARGSGGNPESLQFDVRYPYEIGLPERVYAEQWVGFSLQPVRANDQPPQGIVWHVSRPGENEFRPVGARYRLHKPGTYKAAALNGDDLCVAFKQFAAVANPVSVAQTQLKRSAFWASLAWALVAGVAGVIYIAARLPTFGSAMDYLLALAWGLGLSTTVAPKANLVDRLKEVLGLAQGAAQAGAGSEPAASGGDEKVPDFSGMTKAEADMAAQDGKLKLEWAEPETPKPEDTWVIESQEPVAGADIPANRTIKITKRKPPDIEDEGNAEGPGRG